MVHELPWHWTGPAQAFWPLHSMVPMAASLDAPDLHDTSPEQAAVQLSPRQLTTAAQLFAPEQVTLDILPPVVTFAPQL